MYEDYRKWLTRFRIVVYTSLLLYFLGFFIVLPLMGSLGFVYAFGGFLLWVTAFIKGLNIMKKRFPINPFYEEWKKTLTDMGLDFNPTKDNTGYGKYRNHYVTINHIVDPDREPPTLWKKPGYEVEFENPWIILMHLKRRPILPFSFFRNQKRNIYEW